MAFNSANFNISSIGGITNPTSNPRSLTWKYTTTDSWSDIYAGIGHSVDLWYFSTINNSPNVPVRMGDNLIIETSDYNVITYVNSISGQAVEPYGNYVTGDTYLKTATGNQIQIYGQDIF